MVSGVKYELRQLETWLTSGPTTTDHSKTSKALKKQDRHAMIREEIARIQQAFIHEVFLFNDDHQLERYIRHHQRAIIRLMDHLHRQGQWFSHTGNDFYFACLNELLGFLESNFSKYFDMDTKIPDVLRISWKSELQVSIRQFRFAFSHAAVDDALAGCMLHLFRKTIRRDHAHPLTYRMMLYVRRVQRELSKLITQAEPIQDMNESLLMMMYYLDYNSTRCYQFHINHIHQLMNVDETASDPLDKLSVLLKKINQVQAKPGVHYNPDAPPLTVQLNTFIQEEILHVQRIRRDSKNTLPGLDITNTSFRIQWELSVAQIAFFIKLLVDTKVVVNRNTTDLLRFLSGAVMTRRSEPVSYDSFRSKYYNVEHSTRQHVKSVLQKLLRQIET